MDDMRRHPSTEAISRRGPVLDLRKTRPGAAVGRPTMVGQRVRKPITVPHAARALPRPIRRTARRAERVITGQKPATTQNALYYLQYLVIAVVALAIAYSSTVGQWILLAYGIIVLLRRTDSRQPFAAALFMLVLTPFFIILKLPVFADNVALYTYELLVIGTIAAMAELWRENREIATLH